MFYRNEHYELVVPLAHTDEQYSSEVDDEDTHPEFDSIYRSKTFARGAYQKQCPKSTGETTSYLHEGKHLPILSEKIETIKYGEIAVYEYINARRMTMKMDVFTLYE